MDKMSIHNLVGRKVYIKLEEQAKTDFSDWNITASTIGCLVTGVDYELGIWIRGDSFDFKFGIDKDGNSVPQENRKYEKIEVDIFIPWRYIKGIIDIKDERVKLIKNKKEIGFKLVD